MAVTHQSFLRYKTYFIQGPGALSGQAKIQVFSSGTRSLCEQKPFSGKRELFSGKRESFSRRRESFSRKREVLRRRRELFSGRRELFSGGRELFSGGRELFSGGRELFSRVSFTSILSIAATNLVLQPSGSLAPTSRLDLRNRSQGEFPAPGHLL